MDAYWRAANYLSVGQIYLYDNPLLKQPLTLAHVKRMLLGHWGTTPGQNFVYVHLNRVIKKYDLDMIYVSGPGHGGPAVVSNTYLEGTYSKVYPNVGRDEAGLKKLSTQFSFPGGIPSHASPECPGSIHEGGELGYSLSHAFGAVFDNPDLVVACVVGDGEAETGPLATAWHSNKFLAAIVRVRICQRFRFLGLALDEERNASADGRAEAALHKESSVVQAWLIPANEKLQTAREVEDFLQAE